MGETALLTNNSNMLYLVGETLLRNVLNSE